MTTPLDYQWKSAQELVQREVLSLSYQTWIEPLEAIKYDNSTLYLKVPSSLHRNFLSTNYLPLIQNAFSQVIQQSCEVKLLMNGEINDAVQSNEQPVASFQDGPVMLNPKYTFDSFIIGNSNRFAHAACLAVAEAPGMAYNPLFLYGGVGLGKTHLMQAIGHFVRQKKSDLLVMYVTSEKFTNELINAIRMNKMEQFRQRYRYVDVLLIDDIQFIAGKERTQEEFFHTFNALYESQKQIILSSDKPPRDMEHLEERLKSRFEWGLIADIQPPDLETRIAILRKKAEVERLHSISDETLEFIATKTENNIRELEGALIRVIAYSRLTKAPITLDLVKESLKDLLKSKADRKATPENIMQMVCQRFGLTQQDMLSRRRSREISYPRQLAMYLVRELTDLSLTQIGDVFGGRDHTTVLHACRSISSESADNSELRIMLADMRKNITNR